ncbi:MAG: PH domain-containing protein [Candidatus Micrarchaeota archaeon]|nr:PH domain-containing protein [Candidatus Micrarchaeota archaeon]
MLHNVTSALLGEGEELVHMAAEARTWPGGSIWAPSIIFATNKRIIITKRDPLKLNRSYKIIQYPNITSIDLEHGIKYASVHFGLRGAELASEKKKWVSGLKQHEAEALVKFVDSECHRHQSSDGGMRMAYSVNAKSNSPATADQPTLRNAPT